MNIISAFLQAIRGIATEKEGDFTSKEIIIESKSEHNKTEDSVMD